MKKLIFATGLVAALALGVSGGLHAHSGAMGIVKERMDVMKAIGKAMKSLGAMAKGEAKLREKRVRSAAKAIADHSAKIEALFPDTPKSRKGHLTEAAPAIWENNEEFLALTEQMAKNAQSLEAAADGLDRKGLGKFVGKLANDCKACHQKFRIKKN